MYAMARAQDSKQLWALIAIVEHAFGNVWRNGSASHVLRVQFGCWRSGFRAYAIPVGQLPNFSHLPISRIGNTRPILKTAIVRSYILKYDDSCYGVECCRLIRDWTLVEYHIGQTLENEGIAHLC
jgi:hypothetical protein